MPRLPEALGTPQDVGVVPPDASRIIPNYEAGQIGAAMQRFGSIAGQSIDQIQDVQDRLSRAAETAIAQAGGPASYGPGFWQAFNRVTAADGDPGKIRDLATLLRLAGPEGSGKR